MKAIFKRTVMDRILEISSNAMRDCKTIDYILVTPQEWDELRASAAWRYFDYPHYTSRTTSQGISFKTVDLKLSNDPYGYGTRRFIMSEVKVAGHQIVVAPIEYHPL